MFAEPARVSGRPRRPWSVGRHLGLCLVWFLLSVAAAVVVALLLGAAGSRFGWRAADPLDAPALEAFAATSAQAVVIAIGCWIAASRRPDNPRDWLGDRPPRRWLLLALVVGLDALYVGLTTWMRSRGDLGHAAPSPHRWWGEALMVTLAVAIGPLWEELFFRGWLWAGLRERLDPRVTGLVTAALWLACHLMAGLAQTLALVPVAVLLTVARQATGSVRASVLLHAVNNGVSILAARLLLA